MANKQTSKQPAPNTDRVAKLHVIYVLAFAISIVVYHSANLVPPEAILDRWVIAACAMILTIAVWAINRSFKNPSITRAGIWALVIMDIILAGFLVYFERGMASLAVALFAVPLATINVLNSRVYLYATAALATTAYSLASVKYFVDYFNEGYKVQLYSAIGFYGVVFFIIAGLLAAAHKNR